MHTNIMQTIKKNQNQIFAILVELRLNVQQIWGDHLLVRSATLWCDRPDARDILKPKALNFRAPLFSYND